MSRFNHIYEPLTIISLEHESDLVAENHVKIYPSKETAELIKKYRLVTKTTPEGLVILYKKAEIFEAETVDNVLIIDGKEVIDKKIVGYVSTTPDRTFSNWLPEVVNVDLEFYALADQAYRENTKLDALALNEFIVYKASKLRGVKKTKNNINERIKPDAILQINIVEANIAMPVTLTFKIK
ncbi:hypothetical protein [uncultured Kordia sp.]|uniref:hypothetical protein n=1 Tax=uncultured Kordia sp. TaxID=507699 RepID=UPI0026203042|nr:hypothetical protein [uncultured Kordia sp.]